MNSQAVQANLILIRRLADGTVEWIPIQTPPQHMPAAPDSAYTVVDRAGYEAPQTLVPERRGEDLVIKVQGTDAVVLDGFFAVAHASFYPTTNIASGAGPFSGSALTADSPELATSGAGEPQVWSAGHEEAGAAATAAAATGTGGGSSPLLWVGLAAGGLGLAALAGGGGGGSGGESGGGGSVPPPPSDTVPPQITSGATASGIAENSGAGQAVYTATATDASTVTYSLKAGGDASAFSINARTGVVTLTGNPDFETKPSYTFTVVATDAASNSSEQAVSLAIGNLADTPVTITSGAIAAAITENSGANQVVYTAVATATSGSAVTYSLKAGGDAAAFTINSTTGAVRLTASPDYEVKSSYNFTVIATDSASNKAEQVVGLGIKNLDEAPPQITSGTTAAAINENSGAGQVVYTVASTDPDVSTGSTSYSLKPGGDAAAFSINATTGAVTLTANPDNETKASYAFTVVARDAAGNSSEQAVSLAINDLDDSAPTITSGGTAATINENSGPGQVVYTVTSTDTGDISTGVTTYSLKPVADFASFAINATTGAVALNDNPNADAKGSYSFTVVATDAAGNSAERAVTLGINNLDEVPPTITSGGTAAPINENSGSGQVVYTVTSTDTGDVSTGNTTYSLKAVNDSTLFSINANTGAVTLIANPNFEAKPSYSFTVVATDAAHLSSEQAVSLTINDVVDETPPAVTNIALTGSTGAQNGFLNAGDTVQVTVTMTEPTLVNTSGGIPSIELTIGSTRVDAGYVSGSGSDSLVFQYTIRPGDNDNDGISIRANPLDLNSGSIADLAGNPANLGHPGAVGNNPSFIVDTTAPTLSSSTPADNATHVLPGDDIVLTFSETVRAGSGNIVLTSSTTDTIAITDGSQVSISGNRVTIDPTFDLSVATPYSVQISAGAITDRAGNPYAGISNTTTLDFRTEGVTGGPSGLTQSASLWSGSANLGTEDRIMIVSADSWDPTSVNAVSSDASASVQSLAGAIEEPALSIASASGFDATFPSVSLDSGGHVASLENIAAPLLTSQGLVS